MSNIIVLWQTVYTQVALDLQQIFDAPTGGLLHIEPGLWVTQPKTEYPGVTPGWTDYSPVRLSYGQVSHTTAWYLRGKTPMLQKGTLCHRRNLLSYPCPTKAVDFMIVSLRPV